MKKEMISRSNYEIIFIDYFDGKMDNIRQEEFFSFLRMNPDLQEEFNLYSGIHTEPDLTINFRGKDRLKKDTITAYNYKAWLVGYIENDLVAEQRKEVEFFLSNNPTFKPELEILKLSRFVPDQRIIFNKKNALKRGTKIIRFTPSVKRTLSIAAALILFTLTYFLIHQLNATKSGVADQHEKKQKEVGENKNYDVVQSQSKNEKTNILKTIEPKKSENNDAGIVALKPERLIELLQAIKQKEIKETVIPDTLNPIQLKENPQQLAEQKSFDTINNKQLAINLPIPGFRINNAILQQKNLSEIFSEEDLKDLGIKQNNIHAKARTNTENLLGLAANELKKISKSTDISIEKQKNPLGNSVTYAFGVGKIFSISHTFVE